MRRVKYATDTETGERVAVKIIALNKIKKDPRLMSQVEREVRLYIFMRARVCVDGGVANV
jgi:hypothetical protein